MRLINHWSIVLNVVGIISLIYIVVSLFMSEQSSAPLSCFIGHHIVFKDRYADVEADYASWSVILAKLFGFMGIICFLVLGTYIVYYKALVKVDTVK